MAKTVTAYKAAYDLTEFDLGNIDQLAAHTGLDKNTAVNQALFFCRMSLQFRREGKHTSVLYTRSGARCTTASISHEKVAEAYNKRGDNANRLRFSFYRPSEALQALNEIKSAIKTKDDSVALAYALEYAATCVRRLQEANGGKRAQIFFSHNNDPGRAGHTLKQHPYDINPGNSFRKARRGVSASLGKLVPFRKAPKALHEVEYLKPYDPAAEAAEREKAAVDAAARKAAEAAAAQVAVKGEIDRIQNGVSEPIPARKPLTLKKRGGFSL